ncbi:FtsW/RodA/SpoVE family cell cycle protein [Chloroflexota bacterium]|nr:FtsW/RodA/SpoVE family cell cycle protein [Chloroflexota bacterium]
MYRFFPIREQDSRTDRLQSRLLIIAALLVLALAATLTISTAVRYHSTSEDYRWTHWLGVLGWFSVFAALNWQSSRKLPHRDPYLLPIVAALTGIGLMMVWRLFPNMGLRQTVWLILSGGIVFLGFQFPQFLTILKKYKYIWLVLGLVLVALTIIFGENPTGFGPALWLNVFGFYFQPSEPLKLLMVIYLSGFFTDRLILKKNTLAPVLPTLFVIGLALVLLVTQRDLGTAIIFMAIYLLMLYSINGSRWILWTTPLALIAAGVVGYFFIDIVHVRLYTWLHPFSDPTGTSYQIIQSMIGIASGGTLGAGLGMGSPGLIPVAISDFIYAALGEELGLAGLAVVVGLISLLIYRAIKRANQSSDLFNRHLAIGIAYYFGFQSILIIGGNVGLLPLTGVTLPFISYGGSSLLISFIALGILITINQIPEEHTVLQSTPQSRRINWSTIVLVGLLIVEFTVTTFYGFWFKAPLVERPENPRWAVADRFVPLGNIVDRNGQVIITSIGEIGDISRTATYPALSSVVGYTSSIYGQTGIEASMYSYLRGLTSERSLKDALMEWVNNQPPEGLNVRLTLDLSLQRVADDLLGDEHGAVILMNAETGEILTMASHPYFNLDTLAEDWASFSDEENGPLVNRVTQGAYPIGGTLFPFLLADQINLLNTFTRPETILSSLSAGPGCATAPETLDWASIVQYGCVNAQADLASYIGLAPVSDLIQNLGYYTSPDLRLTVAEAAQTGITDDWEFFTGQDLSISPLQLAIAASALSNDGVLTAPRIVNGYEDENAAWVTLPKLGSASTAFTSSQVESLTTLLENETALQWQTVSSTETDEGDPITWFVAGSTPNWQGQPYVIVVALEAKNPNQATQIGLTLLNQAMNLSTSN